MRLRDEATKHLNTMQGNLERLQPTFQKMALVGTASFAALSAGIIKVTQSGAQLEQTTIAFETMLGSAEKAKTLLEDLSKFGLKTPFEITQLRESTKQLLAYGIEGDKVIDTLRVLGDISAGVGMDKLPQLILAFGQVQAATKLTGTELRQFSEAGVPLLGTLAEQFGVTAGEMQEMISQGEVSFGDVEKALQSLTAEGGKFFQLMENQSQTLSGSWSNLQDTITKAMEEIGAKLVPVLTPIIQRLTVIVGKISEWIQQNPQLVITLGGIAVALTGLVAAVGALGLALPVIITGFTLLTGTAGVVIGIIAGVGFAIMQLMKILDIFRNHWAEVWDGVKIIFFEKVQSIISMYNRMKDTISKPIKSAVGAVTDFTKGCSALSTAGRCLAHEARQCRSWRMDKSRSSPRTLPDKTVINLSILFLILTTWSQAMPGFSRSSARRSIPSTGNPPLSGLPDAKLWPLSSIPQL